MSDDAAVILRLALQPSLQAAAQVIASVPTSQSKRIARALGAAAGAARSRRGASEWLGEQASWAIKYRALYQKFNPDCCRSGFFFPPPVLSLTFAQAVHQGEGLSPASYPFMCRLFSAALQESQACFGRASDERLLKSVAHFIQEGAGTGVCVADDVVLTCAHCVSADDDPDEEEEVEVEEAEEEGKGGVVLFQVHQPNAAPLSHVPSLISPPYTSFPMPQPSRLNRLKLLILGSGELAVARCDHEHAAHDLALLTIISRSGGRRSHVDAAATDIKSGTGAICIGNPSEFDLEKGGKITFTPPLFHTSSGAFRGKSSAARVADIGGQLLLLLFTPNFSAGIGPIAHDCWTYWGHSGAPLFDRTGRIIALHNSWDDSNGKRYSSPPDHPSPMQPAQAPRVRCCGTCDSKAGTASAPHRSARAVFPSTGKRPSQPPSSISSDS